MLRGKKKKKLIDTHKWIDPGGLIAKDREQFIEEKKQGGLSPEEAELAWQNRYK